MNTKIFPATRRLVSPIMLAIVIAITTLVATLGSANSVVYAGDAVGGNSMVRPATPTPTP